VFRFIGRLLGLRAAPGRLCLRHATDPGPNEDSRHYWVCLYRPGHPPEWYRFTELQLTEAFNRGLTNRHDAPGLKP